jgi:hypothetical protein
LLRDEEGDFHWFIIAHKDQINTNSNLNMLRDFMGIEWARNQDGDILIYKGATYVDTIPVYSKVRFFHGLKNRFDWIPPHSFNDDLKDECYELD